MSISSIGAQSSDWVSQLLESVQGSKSSKDDDLASKLMSDLDADGTSTLSLEESGLSESLFTAADADGDGQITAQELADALAQERAQMMAGSSTSGAGLLGTLLSQAGVGMTSQDMGQTPPPPDDGAMADDIISSLDSDGDSALSMEESGLSEEVFNSIDTDGDGVVSSQELADALKSEREQMMAAGGPDGAGGAGGAGAIASNADADKVLQSLIDSAQDASEQINSAQLRKALQAYGNTLMSTLLGEYDATSGISYQDYLSSGELNLLNYIGTESVDYTV